MAVRCHEMTNTLKQKVTTCSVCMVASLCGSCDELQGFIGWSLVIRHYEANTTNMAADGVPLNGISYLGDVNL